MAIPTWLKDAHAMEAGAVKTLAQHAKAAENYPALHIREAAVKRLRTYILALSALLLILTACDNRAEQEASLNEELEALQAQVGSFESQVEEQTNELETARQRVNELEAQLAEQEPQIAQVEQIQQQLAARTSQLQQAQTRIRNLEQRRELTLESQLEEIDRLMERLRAQRSELTQRLEAVGATPAESDAVAEPGPTNER